MKTKMMMIYVSFCGCEKAFLTPFCVLVFKFYLGLFTLWFGKLPMVLFISSKLKIIYTTFLKMPLFWHPIWHNTFPKEIYLKTFKEGILIIICTCISIKHHWGLKTYSIVWFRV
jgi:hypothetical protein